jgi:hypothetical protein
MKKLTTLLISLLFSFSLWGQCDGHTEQFQIEDPFHWAPWSVPAKVFRPPEVISTSFPVVFLLPPVSGETPIESTLALNFCLQGMAAYVLDVTKDIPAGYIIPNLNIHDEDLQRAQIAVSSIINKLESDSQVNGKFGVLGASLGGIISAYLAGAEPRLQRSVVIAGGGNIAGILADSEEERVSRERNFRFNLLGITQREEYEQLLVPFIQNDPLAGAKNIAPNSMMIFLLTLDSDVPTVYQRQLAEQVPEPRVIELERPHIPGIVEASSLFADEITDFLQEGLKTE